MHRRVIPVGVRGRRIKVQIIDAHEGIVFTDTHIAEIAVNFPSGPLTRYDNWLQAQTPSGDISSSSPSSRRPTPPRRARSSETKRAFSS